MTGRILLASLAALLAGSDVPEMTPLRKDVKPFEYVEAKVPFYNPERGKPNQALTQMQKPLEPAESIKHLVYPVGFEPQLFVSDAQLGGKPIAMNWDERGRLWVAVTVDYPNELQPAGQGRDKILICEDTDGDGKADKFTVFADKLSIPTSLIFARGGVIVQQAPHTLFFKDTDGDDVADQRTVLFTGWGTRDTHAGPSNLRYGLDNWIHGIVGYSGFDGDLAGAKQSFRQGFYRFRADGLRFEFLRSTNNNSWGVGFSEEGLHFGSTANGNPSVYLPIANRYYEKVRGWSSSVLGTIAQDLRFYPITDKIRQVDWHGQFTAAAGHALYTARTYPREYWNRTAFVTEPTGHLVATFVLERHGADVSSRNAWNLLASDDEWTAPTMAEVGPDGHVWIIDWYNYIVQHNPTPAGFQTGKGGAYETDLRDKKRGRIYRLVYKNAPSSKPISLRNATPAQLLAALRNDNMFWRLHAQRLLVERGQLDVVPGLIELATDSGVDVIGLNPGAIHALWTLQGLGALEGDRADAKAVEAVRAALGHKSAGVRRNSVAVLPRGDTSVRAVLKAGLLADADAQVRLAALLALAEMPASAEAAEALVGFLARTENLGDRWLMDAATSAAATHDVHFLKTLALAKELPAARALDLTAVVAEHHARGGPVSSINALLVIMARGDPKVAEVILKGLAKGWPATVKANLKENTEKALAGLLPKLAMAARGQLIKLATTWGSQSFQKYGEETARSLLEAVANDKLPDDQRSAAARQLIDLRPADAPLMEKLLDLVTPRLGPAAATGFLEAVGQSQAPRTAALLLERYATWPPSTRSAALRVLLARTDLTRTLLEALDKGHIQLSDLGLEQKQALAAHPDAKVAAQARKLLARGGALPNPDRQKVIDELLPLTKLTGDPALGKAVFKKHCSNCHIHNGEGNKVGPDLTGMAVHPKAELVTHIFDPNRSVEGNYRVYTVSLRNGRTLSGLLASETKTSVEVIDAEAKRHQLLREDIDELAGSNKSLMPEGFEKQLAKEEITNLLEYLTQRGKYLPLPLDKVASAVSTRGMFNNEEASVERLIFPDWKPKTFAGVPFNLVDPQGEKTPNVVLLYGPNGKLPPRMPRSVSLPCNTPAKAIHLLSGVSGWGHPGGQKGSVSMIVRLVYEDGQTEDHALKNGLHFADYIRHVEVPESKFAFDLRGRQIRYLSIIPKRATPIKQVDLVKGTDATAPVVMAVTVETAP